MISFGINIEDCTKTARAFAGAVVKSDTNVSLAIDKIAPKILEEMKATAPVRTGALRDSLKIDRRGPAVAVIGAFRGVQNGAGWRAHFVEDGTAHTPPRPFIKPAGRKFQGEFARTLVTMPVFGK